MASRPGSKRKREQDDNRSCESDDFVSSKDRSSKRTQDDIGRCEQDNGYKGRSSDNVKESTEREDSMKCSLHERLLSPD
jgi:hypothetical protein